MNARPFIPRAALVLSAMLVACGGSDSKPSTTGGAKYVRFAAPTAGVKLSGLANVQIESTLVDQSAPLTLKLGSQVIAEYDELARAIRLDTTRFSDGAQTLRLEATTDRGEQFADEVAIQIDNPIHRFKSAKFDRRAYGRGESIRLELQYTEPGLTLKPDFSAVDTAFDANEVEVDDLGGGLYGVRYALSQDDAREPLVYEVPITSIGRDAEPLVIKVPLQFLGAPRLPLEVTAPDSVFSDRTIPLAVSPAGPRIESVVMPGRLIQGEPQSITVRFSATAADPVDRILLSSPDSSGTWVVPLSAPSAGGQVSIPLQAKGSPEELTTKTIPISAAAVGTSGFTRGAQLTPTEITTMKQIGVKFLLNWSTSADLDLEVTTPDGSVINFMSPEGQGGVLERDSNSTCGERAAHPVESIAWSAKNMIPGQYGLRISQFDSCDATDTPYTLTILACGRATSIPGRFGKSDSVNVQETELPPYVVDCFQRLAGRVTFDKENLYGEQRVPAVGVDVRIAGGGIPTPITTRTDDNGEYDVILPTAAMANIEVSVDAAWRLPGASIPRAQVWQLEHDMIHSVTSVIDKIQSPYLVHDVAIPQADNSGAFNILEVMRRAFIWKDGFFNDATAATITPLVARWTKGSDTPEGGNYYWCRNAADKGNCGDAEKGIWIRSRPKKYNEFSDSAIAHEFGHHVASMLRIDDSPGGGHGFDGRIVPAFAWSEGLATAVGQHILESPLYLSGPPGAFSWVDIEDTPDRSRDPALRDATQGMAYGTDPANDVTGKVNEFLVAGILYDLLDSPNEPGNDELDETPTSVARALAFYLPSNDGDARGGPDRDLVDFLDGWRCYRARACEAIGELYSDDKLLQLVRYREYGWTAAAEKIECP